MPELFIPRKFQDIIRYEPVINEQGEKVGYGVYNPNTDVIIIDPEAATVSTLCEELYHRKQHHYLVERGLYPASYSSDLFYNEAEEIGIRPIIRSISIRTNTVKIIDEVSTDYIRYFKNAAQFAHLFDKINPDDRDAFIAAVRGNKLFDGIQAVLEYMESGFKPFVFNFMAEFSDSYGEKRAWDKINDARKRW